MALTNSQKAATMARVERLRPDMRPQFRAFFLAAWDAGHDVVATQADRDDAAQLVLWKQGRTTVGPKATPKRPLGLTVTNARTAWETPHGCRCAIDFAFLIGGKLVAVAPGVLHSWSESLPWAEVGAIAESVGLAWGGRWHSPDKPHVEHPDWRTIRGARTAS